MKRFTIILLAIICVAQFACNSDCCQQEEAIGEVINEDPNVRGSVFEMVNVEKFDDMLTSMEGIDTMDAIVTGKVASVCKKKGCWMKIVSEKADKEMFVQFEDYGFFMPLELEGNTVTMKGTAYKSITSVEDLQHYAEDDGQSKEEIEAITEPKEELKFLATGVVIDNVKGKAFEITHVEKFDDFLVSMEGIDTMDAVVQGKVESVCKKKGCWMNVVSDKGDKMFVQFEDYGFFMPLDLSGATVTMKGTAYKSVTSVEDLQHYAEDDGKSKEEIAAITEPKEELKFLATGVVIGE